MSKVTFSRRDSLVGIKLRHWANRRHPDASPGWVYNRYWSRHKARWVCATPATCPDQASLTSPSTVSIRRQGKGAGNRSPYEGDWVYGRARQGRYPTVNARLATWLKRQSGCWVWCGLYFQQEDPMEMDHIDGDRKNSRRINRHALHGHCHDAKPREHKAYLPAGMRDKHQKTEERRDRKRSCSVLKQR
jgi:RNA-directed DNA polymerase